MSIPVLSALILIFVLWLQYEIRKTTKQEGRGKVAFWQNEKNSNLTRRVDITNLDFITIPLDRLPLADHENQTINSYRDIIVGLSDKKIVNLTGTSNTDLKYQYGAANINILSAYDNNYTILVSMLQKWAQLLYTQGAIDDAVSVLEYAISCNTDVTKTYKLLASIYKEYNSSEKIDYLIASIPKANVRVRDKLVNELTSIKIS